MRTGDAVTSIASVGVAVSCATRRVHGEAAMPMHRSLRRWSVVLLALGLALAAPYAPWSSAPRAQAPRPAINLSGVLGGAPYEMAAPENWHGGLVVFAHGIQRGAGPGDMRRPPIASHILAEGHAWAASGYRAREYQPHLFIEDLIALRQQFVREIGPPRWTIIYGLSMGGHITVASLELHPGLYQGGLTECGLVDGISIADYLMAYTAAADMISAVPLLDVRRRDTCHRAVEGVVRCRGRAGWDTARGRQVDRVVKYVVEGDPAEHALPLRLEGVAPRCLGNLMCRARDLESEPNAGL